MNERKFRKYKAKCAANRGVDYYAKESSARANTAQRSKVKKLLRRRKVADNRFQVLSAKPCSLHGKALARANANKRKLSKDYQNGKAICYKVAKD